MKIRCTRRCRGSLHSSPYGIHDRAEFYAIMNAVWSDYGKTAQKYGVDKPDFWADLAHDWLADSDANHNKAAIYYAKIALK